MGRLQLLKGLVATLMALSLAYAVVTLAYVATTPDVGLKCLLSSDSSRLKSGSEIVGLTIQTTEGLGPCKGNTPSPGDLLISLAGHRIESFNDLSQTIIELRRRPLEPGAILPEGANPSADLDPQSTLTFVQIEEQGYFAEAWFLRPETGALMDGWVPLQPQPLSQLVVSLLWVLSQLGIVLAGGIAFWHRPYDRPLRLFLLMSLSALVAFIGGSHWWVTFGNLWLLAPFAVAAILLPAVLLHFFVVFPTSKRLFATWPRLMTTAIYVLPVLAAGSAVYVAIAGFWLSRDIGPGPLAELVEIVAADSFTRLLPWLQSGISSYLAVAAGYFLLSLWALVQSYFSSQRRYEHEQVRWILLAALLATLPLGYSFVMAWTNATEFAFGGSQLPLYLAGVVFMAAYAIGIIRYRLMLIDQVLNRGVLYYGVSAAVTLLCGAIVALGALAAVRQDLGMFGHPVLVFVVLSISVIVLIWLRDRLQRSIDREFFREKYPLDRALRKMNQAVAGLLDRHTLADRMLTSCREVLQADHGAIYLRDPAARTFQLLTTSGADSFPSQFEAPRDLLETLSSGLSVQRVRGGSSPLQQRMRALDAELIHGLDVDGTLAGLIVLGGKPGGTGYNAEDVAFLTALGRIAGVTLHFGKLHEDLSRMHAEIEQANDELTRRTEQEGRLQAEIQQREVSLDQQRRRIESLEQQLSVNPSGSGREEDSRFEAPTILGNSLAIRGVLSTVRKTAPTNSSVLIRGESGTGKELLAQAIHQNSPRRDAPLISVHCAALAPGVLESELFGHVRGAFTDARQDRTGRFQAANGGTLFLDEIGDVPLDTQVKLLRVLQERMIEPVGGSKPIPVDVRLIAATHRNLEQFIADGRFREDLYYRLNVISIRLPPLRERGDDIIELAVQFLRRANQRTGKSISHFDEHVLEQLSKYAWPGNIRELENVVERAVVLAEGDRITLADLPSDVSKSSGAPSRRRAGQSMTLAARSTATESRMEADEFAGEPALITDITQSRVAGSDEERQALREALARCSGNKARAARLLGMPRSTFFSKMKKYELE